MRKAASGGDAALSQRDRRRAMHVVPNGYLQKRLTTQNTAATESSCLMMTESIRGESLIREHITLAPAPDPRQPPAYGG
jgi:hypothetical protein